jgi:hypothetical protein
MNGIQFKYFQAIAAQYSLPLGLQNLGISSYAKLPLWIYNSTIPMHTSANFITMLVTRAMSSFSKNHTLLMYRIWKMGRIFFSSLDIRDKVAFLGKNSTNPSINLVTGSDFMKLSSLSCCITAWAEICGPASQ